MNNEFQEVCSKCNCIEEVIYFDNDNNVYCEDCWIEYESKLKGL